MMGEKTDNSGFESKLALRRYFLGKYHNKAAANILDCCQGGALLWNELREEFDIESYWGVDLKKKKGRLKIDSVRILQQPGWPQNVVDVDTYGSPWSHWEAVLKNATKPITVFLTIGQLTSGTVGSLGNQVLENMGLKQLSKRLPKAFHVKIAPHALAFCLGRASECGIIIVEAQESTPSRNCRYVGVRLEPKSGKA